jgi:hypothetical protein
MVLESRIYSKRTGLSYITDGMRRVTYLRRCVCRWKKEIETLYISKRDGKIYILKEKKT